MKIRTQIKAGGLSATNHNEILQGTPEGTQTSSPSTPRLIRAVCLAVAMAFLAEASVMMAYDGSSSCSVWQKVKSTVYGVECSGL